MTTTTISTHRLCRVLPSAIPRRGGTRRSASEHFSAAAEQLTSYRSTGGTRVRLVSCTSPAFPLNTSRDEPSASETPPSGAVGRCAQQITLSSLPEILPFIRILAPSPGDPARSTSPFCRSVPTSLGGSWVPCT